MESQKILTLISVSIRKKLENSIMGNYFVKHTNMACRYPIYLNMYSFVRLVISRRELEFTNLMDIFKFPRHIILFYFLHTNNIIFLYFFMANKNKIT